MAFKPGRYVVLSAVLLTALVASIGCGSSSEGSSDDGASSDEPITVGLALSLSGIQEVFDGPARFAADVAVDDINADDGVDGRMIQLEDADTKSDPAEAANAAIRVLDKGADVLGVGCDFDFGGGSAASVAEDQGVLALSNCGATVKFGPQAAGPLTFTMATSGYGEGSTMGEWAVKGPLKAKTAAIVRDTTFAYGSESVEGFKKRFIASGGEVAESVTFENDDQSFATQVSTIQAADPDVIYISSYMPGEARFLRQLRSAGVKTPILADEDLDGDFWKDALSSEALNDIYYTTYGSIYGDDPNEKVNDLVAQYSDEQGGIPDSAAGLLTGYSVIEAFAAAISESGGSTDGEDLAATMQGWTDKEFLVGPTTFTDTLHITPVREQRIMQIEDGKTSFLEKFRPDEVAIPADVGGSADAG